MKKYLILMLVILLSGCGFHLRGVTSSNGENSLASIINKKFFIESNNFSSFATGLRIALTNSKAIIVTDNKKADYIINIKDVAKTSKTINIVGGASNKNYQLIYTVNYNVTQPNEKKPIIADKTLKNQQFFRSNASIQLAQDNKADRVYENLQKNVTTTMINH